MYKKTILSILIFMFCLKITYSDNLQPTAIILVVDYTNGCNNENNGTITINASGGTPPYEYSINDGASYQTSNLFTGLAAGTYNIKVKDSGTEYASEAITIVNPDAIEIKGKTRHISCHAESTGYIKDLDLSTGGTPPYLYSKDGGGTFQSNPDFLNLPAGDYTIVIKDQNGCTENLWVVLTEPNQELLLNGVYSHVRPCYGAENGSISMECSGGTPPYQYSIDGGFTKQDAGDFNNLSPDFYTVLGIDAVGCSVEQSLMINQPTILNFTTSEEHITACSGDNTGKITVNANGGGGSYLYSLNETDYQSNNIFSDLSAGNYTVYVKDNYGCIKTKENVLINQPNAITIETIEKTNISCHNANDGKIMLKATGGSGTLEYKLNSTPFQIDTFFTNLSEGNYQLFVRDANNCQVEGLMQTIINPALLTIDSASINNGCYNSDNGKITIHASGGTLPYSFRLDLGSYQNDSIFTNLTYADYQLYLKDKNNCLAFGGTKTIVNPPELIFISDSINHGCNNQANGKIFTSAQGGTGKLIFKINNTTPQDSGNYYNLATGDYEITVTDENNCILTSNMFQITNPAPIMVSQKDIFTGCHNQNDKNINLTAVGGTGKIRYKIDETTYQKSGLFTYLAPQTYHFAIKDENNCLYEFDETLTNPDSIYLTKEYVNGGCFGESGGNIELIATGGTGLLLYQLNSEVFATDCKHTNLLQDDYQVTIKDENNCTRQYNYTIKQPSQLVIDSIITDDITCYGKNNGKISVFASGGTKPYYYSKDSLYFQDTSYFGLVAPGKYKIFVKDAANCIHKATDSIIEPGALVVDTIIHANISTCKGDNNGAINIFAYGGIEPLSFSIDSGITYRSNTSFSNLYAGKYHIFIKDKNNCMQLREKVISEPPLLHIDSVLHTDVTTCNGDNSGMITAYASGGIAPLKYSIDGGTTYQNSSIFPGLKAGTHQIIVKDAFDCVKITYDTLVEPPAIFYSFSKTDITCNEFNNGSITIYADGGSGNFVYSINDGASYENNQGFFENLSPANYSIKVKDQKACTAYPSIVKIEEPEKITIKEINSSDLTCDLRNNGIIEVEGKGGTGQLTYYLSQNDVSSFLGSFTDLNEGIYTVTIQDENNCIRKTPEIKLTRNEENCIEIPAAFSPNADGINDLWTIRYFDLYQTGIAKIFDRHGKLLFVYKPQDQGWDGTYNGKKLPMGTYWYILNLNNKKEPITGYFTLLY